MWLRSDYKYVQKQLKFRIVGLHTDIGCSRRFR